MLLQIIYVFFFSLSFEQTRGIFLNKYIIDVESAFLCPENSHLESPLRKYQIDRINRTHRAISAEFSLLRPIDDSIEAVLEMEHFSGGKWIKIPFFSYLRDPCKNIMKGSPQTAKDVLTIFGRGLGLKHPENCDIPAGNYSLDRFLFSPVSEVPLWGGRYRVKLFLRLAETKEMIWCAGSFITFAEMN